MEERLAEGGPTAYAVTEPPSVENFMVVLAAFIGDRREASGMQFT
jgi:hypothetical protein